MSHTKKSYNLLFIFTSVGLFQSEGVAGVRKSLININKSLTNLGHNIKIIAPKGSIWPGLKFIEIPGSFQDFLYSENNIPSYPIYKDSFLGNALNYAKENETQFDFIINFSNDWLPYYLTKFFNTPLLHRMNMAHENEVVSDQIRKTEQNFPFQIGVLSSQQAYDVGLSKAFFKVEHGFEIDRYPFHDGSETKNQLAIIARVSPEKGIEDAAKVAQKTNNTLLIFGYMQNQDYFERIKDIYGSHIEYMGFLYHKELTQALSSCKALLCTHKWVDAFPSVIIQAMACGVPVISYQRGGVEVIQNGKTGFLIPPDDTEAAVEALGKINTIDRRSCRRFVVENYSIERLGKTYEKWFEKVISIKRKKPNNNVIRL